MLKAGVNSRCTYPICSTPWNFLKIILMVSMFWQTALLAVLFLVAVKWFSEAVLPENSFIDRKYFQWVLIEWAFLSVLSYSILEKLHVLQFWKFLYARLTLAKELYVVHMEEVKFTVLYSACCMVYMYRFFFPTSFSWHFIFWNCVLYWKLTINLLCNNFGIKILSDIAFSFSLIEIALRIFQQPS